MINGDKMKKYIGFLVAPDGGWIIDYFGDTIEKVHDDLLRNIKGYTYPYRFVIETPKKHSNNSLKWVYKKKIIDVVTPDSVKYMRGWNTYKAIKKIIAENSKPKKPRPIWDSWNVGE